MRKVMLVEDEELILRGLENIIDWEALGLTVFYRAHNWNCLGRSVWIFS